jgi:hypothetical protein
MGCDGLHLRREMCSGGLRLAGFLLVMFVTRVFTWCARHTVRGTIRFCDVSMGLMSSNGCCCSEGSRYAALAKSASEARMIVYIVMVY